MTPQEVYAGKAVCLNCDHWAQFKSGGIGFCVEPTSPQFHENGCRGCSLHSLREDVCSEFLEIPEARGLDRRSPRGGVVDA